MTRKENLPKMLNCKFCKKKFNTSCLDNKRLLYDMFICNKCNNEVYSLMKNEKFTSIFEKQITDFLEKPIIKDIINNGNEL